MTREEAWRAWEYGLDPRKAPGELGGPVLPEELKAYFFELMQAVCSTMELFRGCERHVRCVFCDAA